MRSAMRLALTTIVLAACASAGSGGGSGAAGPRRNPDVITAAEVADAHVQNAYDAVAQLRPAFLASQGSTTVDHPIQVVVDDVPQGGLSVLRGIDASEVVEIRRISPADATQRWGTGYSGGALLVKTLRGGRG